MGTKSFWFVCESCTGRKKKSVTAKYGEKQLAHGWYKLSRGKKTWQYLPIKKCEKLLFRRKTCNSSMTSIQFGFTLQIVFCNISFSLHLSNHCEKCTCPGRNLVDLFTSLLSQTRFTREKNILRNNCFLYKREVLLLSDNFCLLIAAAMGSFHFWTRVELSSLQK